MGLPSHDDDLATATLHLNGMAAVVLPSRYSDSVARSLPNAMKSWPAMLISTRRRFAGRSAAPVNRLPPPRYGDSATSVLDRREGVSVQVEEAAS